MEYDESPERCAIRETKEELNVDVKLDGLFGVYSGKDDPRTHAVLIMYWAKVTGGKLKPGDDAQKIQFFAKGEVPANIAFLAHRQIIKEFFQIKQAANKAIFILGMINSFTGFRVTESYFWRESFNQASKQVLIGCYMD